VIFCEASSDANSSLLISGSFSAASCSSMLSNTPGISKALKSGFRFSSCGLETTAMSTEPSDTSCRASAWAPSVSFGNTSIDQLPPVASSSAVPQLSSAM